MNEEKKLLYTVSIKGNKAEINLHSVKYFDADILGSKECEATLSGNITLDNDLLTNLEDYLFSKLPIGVSNVGNSESVSKKEEVRTKNKEVTNVSVPEPYVPTSSGVESNIDENVTSSVSDYFSEIPPPPDYESSNKKPQKQNKSDDNKNIGTTYNKESKEDGIKDVQILAITTQLDLNKADYKELVKEAFEEAGIEFEEIPPIEELTYKQAIEVIKYGNKKFKR